MLLNEVEKRVATVFAGKEMKASMKISGAMMDMLSTVYMYILMAAIREGVQNACDAAKRAGLSLAEGVLVSLPTAENPMITISDKGDGMSREFMTNQYLTFGETTKMGDVTASGGLGVGRWAAYGYIGEAYITTCSKDDLIERTYFQCRGEDGIPRVVEAGEVAGLESGTKVYFPVKESDISEAWMAVAYIQDLLRLTLGETFSVDAPYLFEQLTPACRLSKPLLRLELAEVDPRLEGVSVTFVDQALLQYGRTALSKGGILVMTNRVAGTGGLPFHLTGHLSETFEGCVVEVPLAWGLPFMPSRETLKQSDLVEERLAWVQQAMATAFEQWVTKQCTHADFSRRLDVLALGQSSAMSHAQKVLNLVDTPMEWKRLRYGAGFSMSICLEAPEVERAASAYIALPRSPSLCKAQVFRGMIGYSRNSGGSSLFVHADVRSLAEVVFVGDNLPSGGLARIRKLRNSSARSNDLWVVIRDPDAETLIKALAARYGNKVKVMLSSELPAETTVSRSTPGAVGKLTMYSAADRKQVPVDCLLTDQPAEIKPYVVRLPGGVEGYSRVVAGVVEGVSADVICRETLLRELMRRENVKGLYLLSEKQHEQLLAAQAEEESLPDEEQLLAGWIPLDQWLLKLLEASPTAKAVFDGVLYSHREENYKLNGLLGKLGAQPLLGLAGTALDRALSGYMDVMTGSLVKQPVLDKAQREAVGPLIDTIKSLMPWLSKDHPLLAQMSAAYLKHKGVLYDALYFEQLVEDFPLLRALSSFEVGNFASAKKELLTAIVLMYGKR